MNKIGKFSAALILLGILAWTSADGLTAGAASLPEQLVPVGETVGICVESDGVIVVSAAQDAQSEETLSGDGLRAGDIIVEINGIRVSSGEDMAAALADSGGGDVAVRVLREGRACQLTVPTRQYEERYVLGVWARDCMMGLGTLTYIEPETGAFGALGHKVSDVDTGVMLPLLGGQVYAALVSGVIRSIPGTPGQIQASFVRQTPLGTARSNNENGLFGVCQPDRFTLREPVPVAEEHEIHTGAAVILSDVGGGPVCEYAVEITRLYTGLAPAERTMLVTVTDPALLERTGGIVQGM